MFRVQEESFAWAGLAASKTIGVGADFVTVRPVKIEGATWRSSGSQDNLLDVVNWDTHDRVWDRTTGTSVFPTQLFYDPAYPMGVIYLTPIPSEAGTILLRTWKPLTSIALISDAVAMPPGYQYFFELLLATQIARENGMQPSPDLVNDLRVARGVVKSGNNKTRVLQLPVELAGAGRYNIYRG